MSFWKPAAFALCFAQPHTASARYLAHGSLPTLNSSFGGLSENTSLDLITNYKPPGWDICIAIAIGLYDTFERTTGPDIVLAISAVRKGAWVRLDSTVTLQQTALQQSNIDFINANVEQTTCDSYKSVTAWSLSWPKTDERIPAHQLAISQGVAMPRRNLLAITLEDRGELLDLRVHLSDFTWTMWVEGLKRSFEYDWEDRLNQAGGYLTHILQQLDRRGDDQKAIVEWAVHVVGTRPGQNWITLTRESGGDAFWAILGTEAGAEILKLITDHKETLKYKGESRGVKEITVIWDRTPPIDQSLSFMITLEGPARNPEREPQPKRQSQQ